MKVAGLKRNVRSKLLYDGLPHPIFSRFTVYLFSLTLSGPGYFRLIQNPGGKPPRVFASGASHGHVSYVVVSYHSIRITISSIFGGIMFTLRLAGGV